jgi:F0F1-type ATP synthase membrane subunit c/vacuolar-type H+-ATPase subunit K
MTDQGSLPIASPSEGESAANEAKPATAEGAQPVTGAAQNAGKGLGLEVGNIAALPDAEDFSSHDFYRANFTPSEIDYCVKQTAVKAAFQGLLSAKRAIIRSGAATEPAEGLSNLAIMFDGEGKPVYPGCLLSTSDTGTIAAAVCLWLSAPGLQPVLRASGTETVRRPPVKFRLRTRIFAFLILLSLLVIFGLVLWKVLQFSGIKFPLTRPG